MKKQTLAGLLLFASLGLGCASTMAVPLTAPSRCYSPAQIERIMTMREWGEARADVAKEVGGTRADIRAAERLELARRRDPHAATLTVQCPETDQRSTFANR
jgi:hypothetical protein